MATGAVQVFPVVDHGRLRLELVRFLVAIGARNCDVPTCEHEVRLSVSSQAERGRLVALEIMAAIAGVKVGSGYELSRMPVGMTVGAAIKPDLEQSIFSPWDMALRAFQSCMTALQRIGAGGMLLHSES